jgi:hypothetical protein
LGIDRELSTWEDHDVLKRLFLAAPAWGQADTQADRDVSTTTVTTLNDDGKLSEIAVKRDERGRKRLILL